MSLFCWPSNVFPGFQCCISSAWPVPEAVVEAVYSDLNGIYLSEVLLVFELDAAPLGSLKPHSAGTPRPYGLKLSRVAEWQ